MTVTNQPAIETLSGFLGHATAAFDDADIALALFHQQGRKLLLRVRHRGKKPLLPHDACCRSPVCCHHMIGDQAQRKSKWRKEQGA